MDKGRDQERYLLGGPNWTFQEFFGRLSRVAKQGPPRLKLPDKLARAGWTKRTLEPGDQITVSGTPHTGGSHILQIRQRVGPDGSARPSVRG